MNNTERHSKILKKLHYCRFGGTKKVSHIMKYIDTWKKICPDYDIIERNEKTFDIAVSKYSQKMYATKKRSFLSDYARCWILYHEGGIYLDTDMQLVKNIDELLDNNCFLGFQDSSLVNGAIIGAKPQHWLMKEIIEDYDRRRIPPWPLLLPNVLTRILKKHGLRSKNCFQPIADVVVYPKEYFYPFAYFDAHAKIKNLDNIKVNTYAIHWNDAARIPKIIILCRFPIVRLYHRILKHIT